MGSAAMNVQRCYNIFEETCRQVFKPLIDQFNFKIISVDRGPINVGVHITYGNATTAMQASFEPQEEAIWLYLIRLTDGKIPEYPHKYPENAFYLEELLQVRAPNLQLRTQKEQPLRLMTKENLKDTLERYVEALRTHASDVLMGDFRIFADIQKLRKEHQPGK